MSRRTPSRGPNSRATASGSRGTAGPARMPRRRTGADAGIDPAADRVEAHVEGRQRALALAAKRPRLTGRAVIMVLVLLALALSYASSLQAYLHQRSQISSLEEQISERADRISDLEVEKDRWQDKTFIKQQARERFGYLMPGETGYEVLTGDGTPLSEDARLADPTERDTSPPEAWWGSMWGSVEEAGNPKRFDPAEKIKAPKDQLIKPKSSD